MIRKARKTMSCPRRLRYRSQYKIQFVPFPATAKANARNIMEMLLLLKFYDVFRGEAGEAGSAQIAEPIQHAHMWS